MYLSSGVLPVLLGSAGVSPRARSASKEARTLAVGIRAVAGDEVPVASLALAKLRGVDLAFGVGLGRAVCPRDRDRLLTGHRRRAIAEQIRSARVLGHPLRDVLER